MKKFNCLCCGDCCSGNMIITCNIYDLYKIAKKMNFTTTKELFENKIVKLNEGQNGVMIPEIIFKTSPYKFCPFLINDIDEDMNLKGFCSLHPYTKPLVCILAPYSKEWDSKTEKVKYFVTIPTESCPGNFSQEDTPESAFFNDIDDEIDYENRFFTILDSVILRRISNYSDTLYHFNTEREFSIIIDEITQKIESL